MRHYVNYALVYPCYSGFMILYHLKWTMEVRLSAAYHFNAIGETITEDSEEKVSNITMILLDIGFILKDLVFC